MSDRERKPIPARFDLRLVAKCGARCRTGLACRQPAMKNGRCKMHGGKSTGPRTPEGIERLRAARTVHGLRSAKLVQFRRELREMMQASRRLVEEA